MFIFRRMNPNRPSYDLKNTPEIKKYSGKLKQDNIEFVSSCSKAPPTCAITTRIMQTPLVKSTKSIRLLWLPSIISFNFSFSAQRYFINRNKKRNIEKINEWCEKRKSMIYSNDIIAKKTVDYVLKLLILPLLSIYPWKTNDADHIDF